MCGVLSTGERNREIDSRKYIIFHCQKRHSHCSPWPATSQSNWVRFEFKTFFLCPEKKANIATYLWMEIAQSADKF
jgi:hypothetical protein